jgi:transposase-like protein
MASKYTEQDRARVFVVLTANGGNVKRTARDTGLPISTVGLWKRAWEEQGPPDVNEVEVAAGDFVDSAARVRDKALAELERKIPDATPSALVATVGMLQDKISLARGLATSRSETVHALPPAEDIAKALSEAFQVAIDSARLRDAEIIDAEVIDLSSRRELTAATAE